MKRGKASKKGFTLAGFVKLTVVLTLVLTLVMLALPVALEQASASFTKEQAVESSQPPAEAERR
ncbi:MAG TPA: hypothetical protein VJS44_07820 [Pyrinomonadaceae bacterium]|nr:hypothetical protein [Pyrinomonadaceae bacterium]